MKVIDYAIVKKTLQPIRVTSWQYDTPGKLTTIQGDDGVTYNVTDVWSQSIRDYEQIVKDKAAGTFDPEQWKYKQ